MQNQVNESFSRQFRLIGANNFRQVFKDNIRQQDACITILVSKQTGLVTRLGFAIGKKQIPKAVQRNRLKRIFRESFRKNQYRLPDRDIIVMVRRLILEIDPTQLNSKLEKYWDRIIKQCKKF